MDASVQEQVRDLLVGREALERELREDEPAVDRDLEGAAFRRDALDFGTRERGLEFSGQTDRLGQVVSLDAVLDRDLHRTLWLAG